MLKKQIQKRFSEIIKLPETLRIIVNISSLPFTDPKENSGKSQRRDIESFERRGSKEGTEEARSMGSDNRGSIRSG